VSVEADGTAPVSRRPDRAGLLGVLGHDFADPALLVQAFNHRSWCAEHAEDPSNERLEFLGDSILGFLVADLVYRSEPDLDEGALTDVRKAVVNSVCLAEVAIEHDFGDHLRLGKGEEQSGGREKPSILADAVEAVLGAVYLDGGMDAARGTVLRLLGPRIRAAVENGGRNQDHKSRLQEELATRTEDSVLYEFEASGPDHARHFTVTVSAGGRPLGVGVGRSKKQAEQQAARAALELLGPDGAGPAGAPDALEGADG
jgi:ribonuclease III